MQDNKALVSCPSPETEIALPPSSLGEWHVLHGPIQISKSRWIRSGQITRPDLNFFIIYIIQNIHHIRNIPPVYTIYTITYLHIYIFTGFSQHNFTSNFSIIFPQLQKIKSMDLWLISRHFSLSYTITFKLSKRLIK